jgi:hypothetical protein
MRNIIFSLTLIASACVCSGRAKAASVVLDSFSTGPFNLSSFGQNDITQNIQTFFTNQRGADVFGAQESYATAVPSTGTVNYRVDLRRSGVPPPGTFSVLFTLSYSNFDNSAFNLLGYDSIKVRISELVGEGEMLAYGNSGSSRAIRIPITSRGDLIYPLTYVSNPSGLENTRVLGFQFFPKTTDFSITIDEIGLVPEPSSTFMVAAVSVWLILRRERGTSC